MSQSATVYISSYVFLETLGVLQNPLLSSQVVDTQVLLSAPQALLFEANIRWASAVKQDCRPQTGRPLIGCCKSSGAWLGDFFFFSEVRFEHWRATSVLGRTS